MSKTQSLKFVHLPNPSPVPADKRAALLANPGFGRVFSDHMVTIHYSDADGWHDAKIEPRGTIPMDPAAAVLHYAQEIFEGLKAYKIGDGATLFRPQENARRFQYSAERLAMPVLPEELFLEAVDQLVSIDRAWIPDGDGSLYIRPFMFANEIFLGVKPSSNYLFKRHRLVGRLLLQVGRRCRFGLGLAGIHARRTGRHGRRQVRRQLCRQPARAGRRRRGMAATRSSSSMPSSASGSRSWAA